MVHLYNDLRLDSKLGKDSSTMADISQELFPQEMSRHCKLPLGRFPLGQPFFEQELGDSLGKLNLVDCYRSNQRTLIKSSMW